MPEYYIGLMSGTSIDGVDAALVDFTSTAQTISFSYWPFPADLKQTIHRLCLDQSITLAEYGALDSQLGSIFAKCVITLLNQAKVPANAIKAIGSHGQTIHHSPLSRYPFSLQIGDPNIIAEQTRITTVADFRRRDMAAGGQGAPLVPAFHEAMFRDQQQNKLIVNIGGIANISILPRDQRQAVSGFDTGPGNTLMDYWIKQNLNIDYDENGNWARTGKVQEDLVRHFKLDPYFSAALPKSTGKEYFSPTWLHQQLDSFDQSIQAVDIQSSLGQLTAETIADAIKRCAANTEQVLICGGGVHNSWLLKKLQQQLTFPVQSTASSGIDPDHVEAMAFAWLARQTLLGQTGSISAVTGAKTASILGGIYQGLN